MIKFLKLVILLLLFTLQSFGQSNTDVQSRFIPSVEYKLNKKLKFAFEYRYALENDLEKFRHSGIQFESKYSVTKKIALSGGYRFTTSFEEDNHRFFGALEYDYKLNKMFTLSSATKYQYNTNSFDPDYIKYFKEPIKMARQKISLDFNVPKSKLSLYTSAEIFLKTEGQPFFKYNRMRYEAGTSYDFKKYGKLGFNVFYEDVYSPLKDDRIVFETKYSISINDLIKKKKVKKEKI